ncbi:MAG: hypothetical protein IPI46_02885 [Bacteroidetes bacterium]|nr:hypothetical protein [Bacteroidota bacterium]
MNRIKQLVTFIVLLFLLQTKVYSQVYGNEWINYSQTYYKFGVFRDDIYRIPISQLIALGLPSSVTGDNLQLFRDGNEMPLYVNNSGVLNSTDYIEFYAEKANGAVDAALYKNPNDQLNPNQNLISDTAYYFITFNTAANHKRYIPRANNLTSLPIKEAYFWDKVKANYRGSFAAGPSYYYPTIPVIYINSSQFEDGEGFSKAYTHNNDSVTYTCLFPYKVSGAPNAYFKTTVAGYSYISQHRVKLFANNNLLADSTFSAFGYKRYNASVPMSFLTAANKMVFKYTPMNTDATANIYDRYGIAYTEFRYPREFNFNNVDSFYFELDPKLTDYYLEITNFKNNGVVPRIYDLTANEFIEGDISIAGIIRFLIPASTQIKKLFLQSQAPVASIGSVVNLKSVQFSNYQLSANQGDYIILSHKKLFDDGLGHDYVADYKNYRAGTQGGSFNPVVVDVNTLYDEFGYGYTFHAQSIKNFLRFAVNHSSWLAKPKYLFIIGKGIEYKDYQKYTVAPIISYPFPVVPSFGIPCSDNLLSDFNFTSRPEIPTGRLPVWQGSEIRTYLEKIKIHEQSLANTFDQVSDSVLWKKNVLHIAGTSNADEQAPILSALTKQENKIKGIYLGAKVTTIKKSSTGSIETVNSAVIDHLFKEGLNLVQFFGHGSTSSLDYNLDNPYLLPNKNRYPVFIANGCSVGNSFVLVVGLKTLGEQFVLAPDAGSIAFIASDNTGLSNVLSTYTDSLYAQFATKSFGKTLGEQLKNNIFTLNTAGDASLRQHAEQIILNGDPATKMYSFAKPDYAIEEKGLNFQQLNITTALDSFDVSIALHNLGQYNQDSVSVFIRRTLPNGIENVLVHQNYSIAITDTLHVRIPVQGNLALGDNSLEIILDQSGFIDEISETNNTLKRVFNVYNDDLVPVYPYEFGIVNIQGLTLKASTLNPFAPLKTYVLQIDTTENFDSPLLNTTHISSTGGVIKWQPPITLQDSTVYYWRTAMDTLYGNPKHKWSYSSFIYIDGSLPGWNQSHYFQFQKDNYNEIFLDSASRKFVFNGVNKKLLVQNVCLGSPPPFRYDWPDYRVKMNGSLWYTDGCDPYPGYSSLQFVVIDTISGEAWFNAAVGSEGRFGSFKPCNRESDRFFEFSFLTAASRKKIVDFIDSIPTGMYVMIQPRLCTGNCGAINKNFIKDWKNDSTIYGVGNTLYHKLYNLGFTMIDSFYKNRPMIFFSKKDISSSVQQFVEADSTKVLLKEFAFTTYLYEGQITSGQIGPAKAWGQFKRSGSTTDPAPGDSVNVKLIGITRDGIETILATVKGDTSLSFIDATQYPYLKLQMTNRDNNFTTPEQLRFWRVLYQLVPEAALNPNRHFVFTDSVKQGQGSHLEVAIENLTELPLDSMLVKYEVIDKDKNRQLVSMKRYFPIPVYDTIIASVDIKSDNYAGSNVFAIEANPDFDQPEQFHPNNIGFLNYYVVPDKQNPLMDVTFDGMHIMDKDIVSAKPFINISLYDENKYLALDDTSLIKVYMRYPSDNPTTENYIPFDGNVLKFIPAQLVDNKSKNVARIEYRPTFTEDGDEYVLIVRANDKSGNSSGPNAYKVGFEVINKASITSLVNYPNPFSTSTQFVFTLTGSQIPSNIKIQILTATGKVVKEITKADLGNIHIGTNITDYKWKGDDQYGQPLANGVYLYRVITNLNGDKIEHRNSGADNWIEKGFGKLYIMR